MVPILFFKFQKILETAKEGFPFTAIPKQLLVNHKENSSQIIIETSFQKRGWMDENLVSKSL